MTCVVCRYEFCWNCLSEYRSYNHFPCEKTEVKDHSMLFTSLDDFRGAPGMVNTLGDAFTFCSTRRKVQHLKQKLGLTKLYYKYTCVEGERMLVFTVMRAVMLLVSGYKLLENVTVGMSGYQKRNNGSRHLKRFVANLSFVLGLLKECVDVGSLHKIKLQDVEEKMKYVEASLQDISTIGIDVSTSIQQ